VSPWSRLASFRAAASRLATSLMDYVYAAHPERRSTLPR
jgi:hypothetical protein